MKKHKRIYNFEMRLSSTFTFNISNIPVYYPELEVVNTDIYAVGCFFSLNKELVYYKYYDEIKSPLDG